MLKNNNHKEVAVTVSTDTFLRLAILTISLIILFFAVKKAEHALLLIFIAFFLSIALNAPVFWISKQLPGKSRALATMLSFLIVIILIGAFIASIAPPLIRQTDNLVKAAPTLVKEFKYQSGPIGNFIRHYHLQKEVSQVSNQLQGRLNNIGGTAFTTVRHVGSSFFALLTVLVLTFMMLVEGPRWHKIFMDIVPKRHHKMTNRVAHDMYRVVQGYVNGQVILAAIAALFIIPAIFILHISYPAALIVVVFVCGLIPLVGHTIGAIIVTSVALFHSTSAAIIILAYYILYMQIEAYIIQPRVQANTTNMSPLLVFASLVIGLSFGGLAAGLLAIPIGGCLRIAVLEFLYTKDIIDSPAEIIEADAIRDGTK